MARRLPPRKKRYAWLVLASAGAWLLLHLVAGDALAYDLYDQAGARWGVSPTKLRCVAWYESRHQDWAYNRAGPYYGRMQFDLPTWREKSALYGWAGYPPTDAEAAVDVAAATIASGESWRWSAYRKFC
jgi:hypothetical protein